MTAAQIAAVIPGMTRVLEGAVVQEIRQPAGHDLLLDLRVPGATHILMMSVSPGFTRMLLTSARPPNPDSPLSFQSLLRARLCGERLTRIEQPGGDRVVALEFGGALVLVAELTGRHANIFLCDGGGTIIGSIRPNLSQRRALLPGRCYVPPSPRQDPEQVEMAPPADAIEYMRELDETYAELIRAGEIERARAGAISLLARERQKSERLAENINKDLLATSRAPEYTRFGEALKHSLHLVRRGEAIARLAEYGEDSVAEIMVPLKPEFGPRENMERYFRLARRLAAARGKIGARLAAARGRTERLAGSIAEAQLASSVDGIMAILERAGLRVAGARAAVTGRRPVRQGQRKPYTEYFIEGAGAIYVGGAARENDNLTFRVARGNDLWFHVIGFPGAHVVAPMARGHEPTRALIEAGARLAASRSQAPEGEKVEVAYTFQKHLRKPRGAHPGAVLVTQEKRILVTVVKGLFSEKAEPDPP
jgi:predicted ribosome quality control (RQC) complex YloA/Tae2 family protein